MCLGPDQSKAYQNELASMDPSDSEQFPHTLTCQGAVINQRGLRLEGLQEMLCYATKQVAQIGLLLHQLMVQMSFSRISTNEPPPGGYCRMEKGGAV